MPFTHAADGTKIAYAVGGRRDAEPLLLIQGLGADARGWTMQKRALSPRFRLLLVDNRGVGQSGRPEGPFDLEVMADDAMAVLDHAGYGSAHVMGASMGGVISQIIALRHPERVRSLTLACTAAHHYSWRKELLAEWAELAETRGMQEFVRREMNWLVGPRSFQRLWPFLTVLGPLAFNVPVASFVGQIRAILAMDDSMRSQLPTVTAPTLVLCGSQDILTPQGDSEEIAELIPGAELAIVRGGAHLFQVEQFGAFNRTVTEFLDRVRATPVRVADPSGYSMPWSRA